MATVGQDSIQSWHKCKNECNNYDYQFILHYCIRRPSKSVSLWHKCADTMNKFKKVNQKFVDIINANKNQQSNIAFRIVIDCEMQLIDGDNTIRSSATIRCFDRQFVEVDIDRINIENVREISLKITVFTNYL